jgi:cellulose synthase/poly-beta-1,6-N-acetylglucosamine synthase-like glycosyltransferase
MAELPGAIHVPVAATAADRLALVVARGLLVWPDRILLGLFAFAVLAVAGVSGGTVVLAVRRARRLRRQAAHDDGTAGASAVSVSVVLAAYNEEAVIERTLRALAASTYPLTEILVVDDGSTDSTAARVRDLATEDPRIRLIRQRNAGKSRALNSALLRATGEIVVTVDADTIVTPTTVGNLVRRFCRPDAEDLAAVAGVVRVGNRDRNILTRWQALEYLTQISVERAAQDHLGAIMIVPGACAAWRRRAVLGVGGYASDTLAEDCDLALTLHRAGWRIAQDDDALSYTEVPETVDALLKQRVRWTYGTVQVLAKRRDMIGRRGRGWLGGVVLPWAATTIALPTLTIPFVTVMALVGLRTQGWSLVVAYMALFAAANLAVAATGIRLARESWQHLLMVPVYRVIFEPLRCYLVYASVISAARGVSPGWNKLDRTGTVTLPDAGQRPVGATSSLAVPPGPAHSFSSPAFTSPAALVLRTSAAHRQPVASSAEALR